MVFVFVWLISLSIIIPRSIHAVAKGKSSLCKYTSVFFIHSSMDGQLGCFQVLTIVNNAVINIRVHIFFQIHVLGFLGYIPRKWDC